MEFKLDREFLEAYKGKKPPFGFNGLGELVYMRTYSRLKEDGTNEDWTNTIQRVVEGTYSIQKDHIEKYNLGWNESKAKDSAEEMFDRMWNMKFLPPGRGLWAMGSDIVNKRGIAAALNNCSFVSTKDLKDAPSKPFEFLMDMSMLGVGVGFDTLGSGTIEIKSPSKKEYKFEVPDSREGWVESLKVLLESYFLVGRKTVVFDYSKVRSKGEPIKGFGGTASGYKPLEDLHESIRSQFNDREGELITETDIVDVMNKIGVCVVAGNVK